MTNTKRNRRRFDAQFKAKVALEAIRERETIAQIASRYKIHPNQISQWKKLALSGTPILFEKGNSAESKSFDEELISSLYEEIGRLKFELDWLKKKSEYIS